MFFFFRYLSRQSKMSDNMDKKYNLRKLLSRENQGEENDKARSKSNFESGGFEY